jgi:hypothetical protein
VPPVAVLWARQQQYLYLYFKLFPLENSVREYQTTPVYQYDELLPCPADRNGRHWTRVELSVVLLKSRFKLAWQMAHHSAFASTERLVAATRAAIDAHARCGI